jgi:hypothetical protein
MSISAQRNPHAFKRVVALKENSLDVELPSGFGPVMKSQLLIEICRHLCHPLFKGWVIFRGPLRRV